MTTPTEPTSEPTSDDAPRLTSDPDEGTGPSFTMTDDVRPDPVSPADSARAVNPSGGPAIAGDDAEGETPAQR